MKELPLILKNIKNKELLPFYFFHGEEPYFIDVALKSLEDDVLTEDEKSFGQTILYGKDTTIPEIISLAQQFPMFGEINLIIIKEAQDLKFDDNTRKILESYIQNPVPTTVLAFGHKYKKLLGTTTLYKALSKKGCIFLSESIKEHQVASWISQELQAQHIKTVPNISHLLAEYLGTDLSRIANEISKLKLILKHGEILDEKLVETHIGISKDFNVFQLQKAIGAKNREKAMKIAYYMGKNPKSNPFVMVIGVLYRFFSNTIIFHCMHGHSQQEIASAMGVAPFALRDYVDSARNFPLKHSTRIISVLREYDLKNKGLGAHQISEDQLLKEMVYKILNIDEITVKVS